MTGLLRAIRSHSWVNRPLLAMSVLFALALGTANVSAGASTRGVEAPRLDEDGVEAVRFGLPKAAAAGRADTHMLDLSTGLVDGRRVLGRPVAGVTAALGRPDFRVGGGGRYRIGWGTPAEFSIEVIFRRSGSRWRSWSIVFRRGGLVADVRIGDLLNRPSSALQNQVIAKYGSTYKLVRGYACRPKSFCSGEFAQRSGLLHFTFGTERGEGTWVTLWTSA